MQKLITSFDNWMSIEKYCLINFVCCAVAIMAIGALFGLTLFAFAGA